MAIHVRSTCPPPRQPVIRPRARIATQPRPGGRIALASASPLGAVRRLGSLALVALLAFFTLLPLLAPEPARADDPKARAIMERVDARDDGDNQTSTLQMILIDKSQKQRVRELRSFTKDKGEDTWSMMFFLAPADVEDTGFLTYDYDEASRDDDQWLYLPALKKTKRIASSDKSGSFMGSDFSYADMTDRPLAYYDYKLLQEAVVDGQPVWVIEAIPNTDEERDETGYTKMIVFIRKDNDVMVRSKIWVKKGNRNKYFEVEKLEQIEDIWVPTVMTMTTKKGEQTIHKTVLRTSDVKFGQKLEYDQFSVRGLETGP
ncbi:MAG: outer membrane lipoprotein-sorting protein [Deltaproteobacteria bacterium]|nr:outer membrane lipoprotein-sorting protein [Deltaproteobacteria bacterium]